MNHSAISSDRPSVSVVMAAYNAGDGLATAIKSIRAQSFTDWELIVINDGSTDQTSAALDNMAAAEPRIRAVHQENAGLTLSLIRGCQLARGRYLARHDSDDWSHPDRLREQVQFLETHPEVGVVSCACQYFGPQDELLRVLEGPSDPEAATRQLVERRAGPIHGSVMMRREQYEAVGGYRGPFYLAQDHDLWLRLAERTKFAYVAKPLYNFRISSSSISSRHRDVQRRFGEIGWESFQARRSGASESELLQEAEKLKQELRARRGAKSAGARESTAATSYFIGSMLAKNRDPRSARYFREALRGRPWDLRIWVRLVESQWLRLTRRPAADRVGS